MLPPPALHAATDKCHLPKLLNSIYSLLGRICSHLSRSLMWCSAASTTTASMTLTKEVLEHFLTASLPGRCILKFCLKQHWRCVARSCGCQCAAPRRCVGSHQYHGAKMTAEKLLCALLSSSKWKSGSIQRIIKMLKAVEFTHRLGHGGVSDTLLALC